MSVLAQLTRRERGKRAEQLAEQHLRKHGLKLIQRNYSCRFGEIDLIMQADQTLVFVEVRYRADPERMSAIETIDTRKQKKIIRTARHFLACNREAAQMPCRFDVIAIDGPVHAAKLQWINHAFEA